MFFSLLKYSICIFFGVLAVQDTWGQSKKINVKTSIFLTDIFNINFPENEVSMEFYIWFKFAKEGNESFVPSENLRIINAKEINLFQISKRIAQDSIYQLIFCKAIIKKNWTITDYPFDEHTIRVFLEIFPKEYIAHYIPITQANMIDNKCNIPGWEIDKLQFKVYQKKWNTNFGDPLLENLPNTQTEFMMISLQIDRPSGGAYLFFKTFTAVLVSVMIAFAALLLSPKDLEVRANFTVGSLFSAVGSQFLLSSDLPESSESGLMDYVHVLSYFFIALTIFTIIITGRLYEKNKINKAKKMNYIALFALPSLYSLLIFLLWLYYFWAGFASEPSF